MLIGGPLNLFSLNYVSLNLHVLSLINKQSLVKAQPTQTSLVELEFKSI